MLGITWARRIAPALFCSLAPALAAPTLAAHAEITADIDLTAPGIAVSPYEYGMFIEPIGGLLARSLWAEMLDDRKFYFPVAAEGKDPRQPDSAEGRPAMVNRKWRPMGPDAAVAMDRTNPYVGAQSVRISLTEGTTGGLRQGGIGLARGKDYAGHIVLSGSARAKVSVALVWGEAPDQRQTIVL